MQIDRRHFIRTASVAGAAGAACAACAALGTPFIAHAQAAREFKIGLITGPSHNWSKAMWLMRPGCSKARRRTRFRIK